ncbi:MAG TPA: ABC transporter permease [Caldilineaceae bacterium]|nr:ABC transporter permease [Caldilineaceae bacterium]
MSILRPLAIRTLTMIGVFFVVMLLLVLTLGLTGYSDRILNAVVGEQLRAERTGLAETIRDPDELERVLAERKVEFEAFYGLDRPWWVRLPGMVLRVMTLDLGEARNLRSFDGSNRVIDIVLERLPNTMILLTTSLLITAVIGLGFGAYMATRAGSWIDRAMSTFAAVSFAIPTWWIGILLILVLSVRWRLLPSGGMYSTPPPIAPTARFLDLLWHAALPILTLVLVSIGPYIYAIRTITLNIAQEDHVTIARAKGLPERRVRNRHILRVAAPPIVTGLIFGLAGSLSGSILVETVFNWQGMGRLYYDTLAGTPDENVIVALTFVFTLMYVGIRILLEVLYIFLDPRVRYSE